MVFTKIFFNR